MPSERGWIVPRDAWGHRELGEAAGTGPGASVGVWHRGQAEGSGPSRPQNWERTRLCCSKPPVCGIGRGSHRTLIRRPGQARPHP